MFSTLVGSKNCDRDCCDSWDEPIGSRYRYTGDRFSYKEAGQSKLPPLLLLHGIGANSLHWRYQLAGLASRFRLIAWNAPGYVLSDNLRAETASGRDYADALDDFLKALGVAGFNIGANSFGTRIAQSFAYHYPGRIDRAIFTGTSIARATSAEERAQALKARAAMIERGSYAFGERVSPCSGRPPRRRRSLSCSRRCARPTRRDSCRLRASWPVTTRRHSAPH
jgi:pimeloyl-ACP methyl ester carboxylesterase